MRRIRERSKHWLAAHPQVALAAIAVAVVLIDSWRWS
jgi:hypothetical protein